TAAPGHKPVVPSGGRRTRAAGRTAPARPPPDPGGTPATAPLPARASHTVHTGLAPRAGARSRSSPPRQGRTRGRGGGPTPLAHFTTPGSLDPVLQARDVALQVAPGAVRAHGMVDLDHPVLAPVLRDPARLRGGVAADDRSAEGALDPVVHVGLLGV